MSAGLRGRDLSPDVRAVLERAEFAGGVLTLPGGQLDRKLYVAVNQALEALGGKWSKKAKGHVFASDAAADLAAMLGSGKVPPKNPDAFFPTPIDVVDQMIRLAEFGTRTGLWVLEPSAGDGAIAIPLDAAHSDRIAMLDCVEVNPGRFKTLEERIDNAGPFSFRAFNEDFLRWDDGRLYHRILMNPPFAVDGDATAWLTHVRRALAMLDPLGILVSVVPAGFEFREDRKHSEFRASIAGRSHYVALPPDAFKESGTGVNCGLLVVNGSAVFGREGGE